MATAKVDHVSRLELVEEDGVVIRLVRRFRVIGLTDTDYDVLGSALDTSGVPAYNSQPAESRYKNLAARNREARLVDGEQGIVDVDVTYLPYENTLGSLKLGQLVAEFGGSVQQVSTNLDREDQVVTVSYTYPADYLPDPSLRGETVEQGGTITYLEPNTVLVVRGRLGSARAWMIVKGLQGKTNGASFVGGAIGTWLCTSARARPVDVTGTPVYDIEVEFQYAPKGWKPWVTFRDPNTGEPPPDLVQGTGYKQVESYEQANFEAVLQARIFGG